MPNEPEQPDQTQIISDLTKELADSEVSLSGSGPRLILTQGPKANSKYEISKNTTLGRHSSSDIYLDDVTVSRQHAEISKEGDVVTIKDMGSLNGTYVNKERIENQTLTSGDEVQIGKFRFLYLDVEIS